MIKEKIKYNGQDMNLKVSFGSHDSFTGFQQEIDNETQFVTIESINSAIDEEKRKFKLIPENIIKIFTFNFYDGSIYSSNFINAGFTTDELASKTLNVRNSFWIFDYYNSFDSNNQKKIFTTYLTTIGGMPQYNVSNSSNQLYYWYVPLSYINSISASTIIGYTKISFFNAKTGDVQLFYNQANESMSTGQKMFFETELNLNNMTWTFKTSNQPNIIGKELVNSKYVERVNDTFNKFNNKKQILPSGNTYDYRTNTYFIT